MDKGSDAAGKTTSDTVRRAALFENTFVFAALFSPDGTLIEANEPVLVAAGVLPGAVIGKPFSQIEAISHSPQSTEKARDLLNRAALGQTVREDLEMRLTGGQLAVIDCMLSPLRDPSGRVVQIAATGVDVTRRKAAESALTKLNRELRMLTDCNQALVRAQSESVLLTEICRIITEKGGYVLAWVGFPQDDATRSVKSVAHWGSDAGYIDSARISWADTPNGRGPTGRAIRERTVQVCRDTETDAAFIPWRNEARRRGYHSSIALPLNSGAICLGALGIYSDLADAFDASEAALLNELADDLAYGISALRSRAKHERAESDLQLFRTVLDRTNDYIYLLDANSGRVLDANETTSKRLGYTRAELLQMNVSDFSVTAAERPWAENIAHARALGAVVLEGRHRCRNGEIIPVEISLRHVEQEQRPYVITVAREITERKRQEEQISRLTRTLRLQSSVNAAVLRIRDRDELLREACRLATQVGGYERVVFSLVDPDGRSARPQFRSGIGIDFPEPAVLPIGDGTEPDTNLSGRALRTGEVTCSDLRQSEPPVAMREKLIELGYKSVVALPLIVDGRRVGVLTLTSRDANLVGDEELLLLRDMMASLSFALRSQEQADTAQFLSYFDVLTGLANRALFCERLDAFLQEIPGQPRFPVVTAFDIHGLSSLNDSFGRHFGDLVLQKVAERLRQHAQYDERIGYLGGGAFALVEPQLETGAAALTAALESGVFGEPFRIEGRTIRLSCRSGVARFPADGSRAEILVQRAEAALKKAKESGEQYVHYRLDIHSEIAERLELEHELRAALDEQHFAVYYQPQLNIATGVVEAVEALLRWDDSDRGLVMPGQFLPVLESSGMITAVGKWVLEKVVEDAERWARLGLGPLRIAVNVSPMQLRQRSFVPDFLEAHRRVAANAGFGLDLEITETVLLQDLEGASRKLSELRAAGIRCALDDFGTGYSSLGLLARLPVDLLKIDRSFVQGLPGDSASTLLIESIVRLARAFGLITVTEGVETQEQLDALRNLGCDLSQGFLHSAAAPSNQIETLLAQSPRGSKADPSSHAGVPAEQRG